MLTLEICYYGKQVINISRVGWGVGWVGDKPQVKFGMQATFQIPRFVSVRPRCGIHTSRGD